MKIGEYFLSGYPATWDSLNVRDLMVHYGSVLRIRANSKGFSFITFDLGHSVDNLTQRILSGNQKLSIRPPDRNENYKFECVPPHGTIRNLQVGFIRWIDDVPYFAENDKFGPPSLCIVKEQNMEFHLWKSAKKYKLGYKLKNIANISCIEKETMYEVFIQFNQPPEVYRCDPSRKFFQIWTIGVNEPGWKRVPSIFDDLTGFLGFEIKKMSVIFEVLKVHDNGLIDLLRSIQNFVDFPEKIYLPPPLQFSDIDNSNLDFQVKFMIYSLISLTIISVYDLNEEFIKAIEKLDQIKVVDAMQQMISSHGSLALRTISNFEGEFQNFYKSSSSLISENLPEYETINRVLVTPTTAYFRIGEPELSNRVTRQYAQYKEDFLRITFTDENLNKILPYPDELLQRVEETLKEFRVAGKVYKILAYSASQLKQHSVWMLNDNAPIIHEEIISWLGDFSSIKVPGKYVARVGLSFSSSKRIIELNPEEIEIIEDIEYNGFNFSDGAGTISPEICEDINRIAGVRSCAFQFRMGGAKGVVVVDDRLVGRKFCLRNSLIKYSSEHRVFELLNPSEFRFGFLNRQLIMLLNTLGTPDEIFITLHHEMLQNINEDCKAFFCCMRAMNLSNLAMRCLDKLMSFHTEPLACEIKSLLLKRSLNQLRKKQKIFLRKSACIIGVIDEKRVLNYGECFLKVTEGIIEGDVVVAKNPCLHPGDIRILKAVNKPELQFLENVVVFPSKGPRPHTNECSGSDLDGDLYFITWENRLIPPTIREPMIYDSTPPMQVPGPYGLSTLIDFFRIFVTNDKLGQIDNLHMAIADSSPDYANDERCIHLSELHSIAVDFAKTGNIVNVPKDYTNIPFPDFMENPNAQSYVSSKILGKLYREVLEMPEIPIPELDQKNLVEGYEQELAKARMLVGDYKKDLDMLMKRFGVSNEIELIIAQPLELTNYFQKKKREDEIRELLNLMSNKLIEKHRKIFAAFATKELASACYFVSHKEIIARAYPWVIAYEVLETI